MRKNLSNIPSVITNAPSVVPVPSVIPALSVIPAPSVIPNVVRDLPTPARSLPTLTMLLLILSLTGCMDEEYSKLAPVVEGHVRNNYITPNYYRVRPGDTLYSIAFRYDQDYRRLATLNHLEKPYVVKVGQVLSLRSTVNVSSSKHQTSRIVQNRSTSRTWTERPIFVSPNVAKNTHWRWPTQGRIIAGFAPSMGRKGVDIAGSRGQTIRASASGTVAYAGDGLPGYGNMILIQHPHQLLSAYAYNAQNLVHAGQVVQAGQPIATMGASPQHRYAMHFEVRKAGKPVNPRYFLH